MPNNPRYSNGNYRRKLRARYRAMNAPCAICHGKLGAIHYDEPSDAAHPLSLVVDEINPVSRFAEWGYSSAKAACLDPQNTQPAHWICNQNKSNKTEAEMRRRAFANHRDVCSNGW